jgi:SAM-dependent methyltransferase
LYEYERITSYWSSHRFRDGVHFQEQPFFDALVEACSGENKRVLDIGCGDGRMPRNLLRHCKPEFYGIDLTEQIRRAPVIGVCGDARCLPFKDGVFDVVYSLGVVEHFPETADAIAEHVRVLKPGGKLFLTTPHLSIATIYKLYQFYRSGQHRENTFEAVRGRNLILREMRQILKPLSVRVIALGGSGVRQSNHPFKRLIKGLIPSRLQHPHLYCIAEKC